jgi:hypothetical protein
MRFVIHDERVLTQQPSMQGATPPAVAVAREKQAAADHIHRANYNRGARWIFAPLAVVLALPAKRANGQRAVVGSNRATQRGERLPNPGQGTFTTQAVGESVSLFGRLIYDYSPVDYPDEAPWQAGCALLGLGSQRK